MLKRLQLRAPLLRFLQAEPNCGCLIFNLLVLAVSTHNHTEGTPQRKLLTKTVHTELCTCDAHLVHPTFRFSANARSAHCWSRAHQCVTTYTCHISWPLPTRVGRRGIRALPLLVPPQPCALALSPWLRVRTGCYAYKSSCRLQTAKKP